MKSCDHCGEANFPGTLVCEHCGLLMNQAATRQLSDANSDRTISLLDTSKLGDNFTITLYIPSADKLIHIRRAPQVIFGRFEEHKPREPYVDFSTVGGLDKGVSRWHAALTRWGSRVHIMDRGSANGTFVNNQPIERGKEVRLFDGDEIHFGLLVTRIHIG